MKKKYEKVANEILFLEEEIHLGRNVKEAEDRIQILIDSLPKENLLEIMLEMDEYIFKKLTK